jgi:hypothetical protein
MTKEKTEFAKFSDLTTRLLSVSKEEISKREAEWKKARKHKRKAVRKTSESGVSRDSDDRT